jgi:hypothetical protein
MRYNLAEVFKKQTDSILRQTRQGPSGGAGVLVETSDGEESIYNPGMGGRDLTTHKSSGDHDGRYYTESEADGKFALLVGLFTKAIHDAEDHEGLPGVGNAIVYRETFEDLTEWAIAHGLGNVPAITVYKGELFGFGTQSFGASIFGGGVGAMVEDTKTPTISVIDDNTLKVTWAGNESGKVVCVG